MSTPYSIAITTCPNSEVATQLAKAIVEQKLAACVNILPAIQSIYQWQGQIESETESLLIIKTMHNKLEPLQNFILRNHPYDVPEFISLGIESGSKPYLDWIMQSLK